MSYAFQFAMQVSLCGSSVKFSLCLSVVQSRPPTTTSTGLQPLGLRLSLRVPFLSAVPLPVPLRHHHSRHHGDQHGDGDDEHGGRFRDAQLTVHPRQRRPGQRRRVAARYIAVVVDVEVAHKEDLAKDAVQVTVASPRVTWRCKQGLVM